MSGERLLLEWVGERFTFPEDAFDRLLRRRNRKVRNQRIASGLLAVIVSILAIAGLLRTFVDRETGDRTIHREPRPSGAMAVQDNGLSRIARGRDLGHSWTLSDQHADPRSDPGPYLVIEGRMAIPMLIDPVKHLADRVSGSGRLSHCRHPTDRRARLDATRRGYRVRCSLDADPEPAGTASSALACVPSRVGQRHPEDRGPGGRPYIVADRTGRHRPRGAVQLRESSVLVALRCFAALPRNVAILGRSDDPGSTATFLVPRGFMHGDTRHGPRGAVRNVRTVS